MKRDTFFSTTFAQWFLKQTRIALLSSQFLALLRRLWLRLPFEVRKSILATLAREEHYDLDFPLNMKDLVFSAQELRPVLQQCMPCNTEFTVFSMRGNSDRPIGNGTYIKRDMHGSIEIVNECGSCQGLMAWLFPITTSKATASVVVPART